MKTYCDGVCTTLQRNCRRTHRAASIITSKATKSRDRTYRQTRRSASPWHTSPVAHPQSQTSQHDQLQHCSAQQSAQSRSHSRSCAPALPQHNTHSHQYPRTRRWNSINGVVSSGTPWSGHAVNWQWYTSRVSCLDTQSMVNHRISSSHTHS